MRQNWIPFLKFFLRRILICREDIMISAVQE